MKSKNTPKIQLTPNIESEFQPSREIVVDGFGKMTLAADEEPRALDLDLGEKLGYAKPRDFRDLIKRLVKRGFLRGVSMRRATRRIELRPGVYREQEEAEYHLTEVQFVMAATQAKTTTARDLTEKIARFFVEARNGLLTPQTDPKILEQLADNTRLMELLAQSLNLFVSSQPSQPTQPEQPERWEPPLQIKAKSDVEWAIDVAMTQFLNTRCLEDPNHNLGVYSIQTAFNGGRWPQSPVMIADIIASLNRVLPGRILRSGDYAIMPVVVGLSLKRGA